MLTSTFLPKALSMLKGVVVRIGANKSLGGYNCVSRIQKRKTVSLKIEELGFDEGAQQYTEYYTFIRYLIYYS